VDLSYNLPDFPDCGCPRNKSPPEHFQDFTRRPPPGKHVAPLGEALVQGRESALESVEDCWVHFWQNPSVSFDAGREDPDADFKIKKGLFHSKGKNIGRG